MHALSPAYIFSGLVVGLLVGLTGVGGGSLMTPLLVLLFGIHPSTAVGTDLLFAAVTKTVGGAVHGAAGAIEWRVVGRLTLGSVPTTVLTLLTLNHFGPTGQAEAAVISTVLGFALVVTSLAVLFRPQITRFAAAHIDRPSARTAASLTVVVGAVLGVLVSISSVGAGALGVTALILLYRDMRLQNVVASDIAHAVPLTLVAGVGHWYLGNVAFPLLASLLTGSIPGIVAGSLLTRSVAETVLRPILAAVLAVVGLRMLA